MFNRNKKKTDDIYESPHLTGRLLLPTYGLNSIVKFYPKGDETSCIPVSLVAIYNTEELAEEIVKRLKNSIDNNSKSNNDSNTPPK